MNRDRRARRHWALVLAAFTAIAPSVACSDPPQRGRAVGTVALHVPDAPPVAVLDKRSVNRLISKSRSGEDEITQTRWPVVPGAEPLTDAARTTAASMAGIASAWVQFGSGGGAGKGVDYDFIGAAPEAIGVRLVARSSDTRRHRRAVRTLWYDPADETVLDNTALLAGTDTIGKFKEIVRRELVRPDSPVSAARLAAAMKQTAWLDSVSFGDSGELRVEFEPGLVAPRRYGIIAAAASPDETGSLLSQFGAAARRAALEPSDPGLRVTPDCSSVRCVALTFDDGPMPQTTEKLLATLAEKDVLATFFVLGRLAREYPRLVEAMHEAGHEVANHSWTHANFNILSGDAIAREIGRTRALIEDITGSPPKILRPPYGLFDSSTRSTAAEVGESIVTWDVDTLDWKHRDTSHVAEAAVSRARAGSIILLHDIYPSTIASAGRIVDGLKDRGFEFVTVSEILGDDAKPGRHYRHGLAPGRSRRERRRRTSPETRQSVSAGSVRFVQYGRPPAA